MIIMGLIAPLALMLLFWFGSVPILGDSAVVVILAAGGFVAGIVLDFTLLRRFTHSLFELPASALFAVTTFYAIMVYGFFMGFPVFNAFVGIACAYVAAKKCAMHGMDRQRFRKSANSAILFSSVLLFILCVCTAVIALREATIESQVQGMLKLSFEVTRGMIWALILAGGALLLAFQYGMSMWIIRRFEKKLLCEQRVQA